MTQSKDQPKSAVLCKILGEGKGKWIGKGDGVGRERRKGREEELEGEGREGKGKKGILGKVQLIKRRPLHPISSWPRGSPIKLGYQ